VDSPGAERIFFHITAGGAASDFAFEGVEDPRRIARTVDHALHERSLSGV
jgi:hypothetical protein